MFKVDAIVESPLSPDDIRSKWEEEITLVSRKTSKGKSLFIHSIKEDKNGEKCVLHYHQNYGGDFCDTMFIGEIQPYKNGAKIIGKITVPTGMKIFSALLFLLSIPIAIIINAILRISLPTQNVIGELFLMLVITVAVVIVGIMSLSVDKRKTKIITDYLNDFLSLD